MDSGIIYTRSILKPFDYLDGTRVSVMSRHTLNDGVTRDDRITSDSYDVWMKILSPPDEIVGDYYKRGLPWKDFGDRYVEYLKGTVSSLVEDLSKFAIEQTVTLLCIEDSAEFCHRRLLAEECKVYEPKLEIVHL